MRISDWSSDVCSSDLPQPGRPPPPRSPPVARQRGDAWNAHSLFALSKASNLLLSIGDMCSLQDGTAEGKRHERQGRKRRGVRAGHSMRSEEHTSELQSLMRRSCAVLCSKKKTMMMISNP